MNIDLGLSLIGIIRMLFIVAFFSLLIFIMYFAVKRMFKRSLKLLIALFVIIVIGAIPEIPSIIEGFNYEPEIHQIVFEGTLDVEIFHEDERSYLVYGDSKKEVTYLNVYEKNPFKSKISNPIYLNDIGDYYVVVFSLDNSMKITDDRFLQGDYEFYDVDHLVLIQKSTGYIFDTQEYELIGNEIDLTSFQYVDQTIFYGVFIPHENNISFYQYTIIQDEYSIEDARSKYENYYSDFVGGFQYPLIHFHRPEDPSELIDFKVAGKYLFVKDSYNNVYVGSYSDYEYGLTFTFDESLSDEEFLLEGYIKITENGIYYLGIDYNVYKVPSYSNPILIEENVTKAEFTNFYFN